MSEVKKFIGQPVLSQILDVIPSSLIQQTGRKHKANRYYKSLPFRVHLVSLLYGVFSYCNGLRELSEGLLACEGKLSHLGVYSGHADPSFRDVDPLRSRPLIRRAFDV